MGYMQKEDLQTIAAALCVVGAGVLVLVLALYCEAFYLPVYVQGAL